MTLQKLQNPDVSAKCNIGSGEAVGEFTKTE